MLILAGVAIATLFGENGILNRAATSGEETKRASAKERLQTELLAIQAEKLSNSQEVTIATLDEKKDELAAKDIQVADSGLPREVTLDGYTFNVKNDLTLEGEGTTIGNGGSGTSGSVNSGEGTSESITQKEGLYRFINGNEGFTTTVGEAELTSLGIKPRTYGGQDSNNITYCKLEKVLSKSLELDDKFELSMSNFINNTNNSSGGAFTINLYKKENNDYIRNAYLKIGDYWSTHNGIVYEGGINESTIRLDPGTGGSTAWKTDNPGGRWAMLYDGNKIYLYRGDVKLLETACSKGIQVDKIEIQFISFHKIDGVISIPMILEELYVGEPYYYRTILGE